MTTAHTITLTDGRVIGFDDVGDPSGLPVVFFHGTPGSRLYWKLLGPGDPAASLGVRLIAPDRPGIGLSSPEPQRSIGSFAFDIARLVDDLEIDRFGVLGFSGGASYALGVAAFMTDRVSAVGLMSPMADLSVPGLVDSVDPRLRRAISLATETPTARASVVAELLGPQRLVHTIAEHMWTQLPAADRAILTRPPVRDRVERMLQETARQGIEGARLDLDVMTRTWDFPLGDITVPVRIMSGSRDPWAPPAMCEWLLRSLPTAQRVELASEGHFTALVRHGSEMIEQLLELMQAGGQPLLGHSDQEAITSSASAT